MRVLVIEDDDDVRSMTASVLRLEGHEVREAGTGREGVSLATADPSLSLALVDLGLPDISGFEVAESLRALGSKLRLVALTGSAAPELSSRCRAAGFASLAIKPVDLQTIFAALDDR